MTQKKYSSSLSRQSSEIKPKTKLVSKLTYGKKPLFCLEYNKPDKQNVYGINLLNNYQSQNNRWHRLMSGMKYQNIAF